VIPEKHVAFVDFDHEGSSSIAKDTLRNFPLNGTNVLKITFAKH